MQTYNSSIVTRIPKGFGQYIGDKRAAEGCESRPKTRSKSGAYSHTHSCIDEKLRSIAYSIDLLIPGLYIWLGPLKIRIGGDRPDDQPYPYPGTIHSRFGVALVLPGYHLLTSYRDSFDPRQTLN